MSSVATPRTNPLNRVFQNGNFFLFFLFLTAQSSPGLSQQELRLIGTRNFVNITRKVGKNCGAIKFETAMLGRYEVIERKIMQDDEFLSLTTGFREKHNYLVNVNPGCEIKVCGVDFLQPLIDLKCSTYSKQFSNLKGKDNFQMTSISCACRESVCREKNYCDMSPQESNSELWCAILYEDPQCNPCLDREIKMNDSEMFLTQNSADILSGNVRENCTLVSYRPEKYDDSDLSNVTSFHNRAGKFDFKFPRSINGPDFSCTCEDVRSNEATSTMETMTSRATSTMGTTTSQATSTMGTTTSQATSFGTFISSKATATMVTMTSSEATTSEVSHLPTIPNPGSIEGIKTIIIWSIVSIVMILFTTLGVCIFRRRKRTKRLKTKSITDDLTTVEQSELLRSLTSMFGKEFMDSTFFIPDRYVEIGRTIGSGEFGTVFEGTFKTVGQETITKAALKRLNLTILHNETDPTESIESLINEVKVLSHIGKHSNLVEFLGVSVLTDASSGKSFDVIFMELCGPQNLKEHLVSLRKKLPRTVLKLQSEAKTITPMDGYADPFSIIQKPLYITTSSDEIDTDDLFQILVKWSKEIASGMEYLHTRNVVHKDLAARNVLLSECGKLTAKVSDFGLSKKLYGKSYYTITKGKISVNWMAPEFFRDQKYIFESDVWSYGVTLWEIFNLGENPDYPIEQKNMHMFFVGLLQFLEKGDRLECPEFCSEKIHHQILNCWRMDPNSRPGFRDLERFFNDLLLS